MRLKTIIELLTLSTSLYTISKDEKLMKNLESFFLNGKNSINDLLKEYSKNEYGEYDDTIISDDNENQLIHQFLLKAKVAKEELETKMEEVAEKIYAKMHITHTNETQELKTAIEKLKTELALAEARIVQLENNKSI